MEFFQNQQELMIPSQLALGAAASPEMLDLLTLRRWWEIGP
jgi:hypothetical protein